MTRRRLHSVYLHTHNTSQHNTTQHSSSFLSCHWHGLICYRYYTGVYSVSIYTSIYIYMLIRWTAVFAEQRLADFISTLVLSGCCRSQSGYVYNVCTYVCVYIYIYIYVCMYVYIFLCHKQWLNIYVFAVLYTYIYRFIYTFVSILLYMPDIYIQILLFILIYLKKLSSLDRPVKIDAYISISYNRKHVYI